MDALLSKYTVSGARGGSGVWRGGNFRGPAFEQYGGSHFVMRAASHPVPPPPRKVGVAPLQTHPGPPLKAVSCINLVNQHGSEGTLEVAFAKESAR
jgi:hypothetical protein